MSFLLSIENLRRMKTDEQRAQWLARAPHAFFVHEYSSIIDSVLHEAQFDQGLIYLRDEADFLSASRSDRGDVPFTFGLRRNLSLLTMLNPKSWRT
jgi:hypothetical protein